MDVSKAILIILSLLAVWNSHVAGAWYVLGKAAPRVRRMAIIRSVLSIVLIIAADFIR